MNEREIDAKVAEIVFGWRWYALNGRKFLDCPEARQNYQYATGDEESFSDWHRWAPHYTTDAAADYSVLCHIRERWSTDDREEFWLELSIAISERGGLRTDDLVSIAWMEGYQPGDYARAALACRASLAAIEKT